MIEIINYKNKIYPKFQSNGFASRFCFPFALEVCKGIGYDIGCMKKEWSLPGSIPIDLSFEDEYHANKLPKTDVDYIFSSHCLEHINNWVETLDYWYESLKNEGTLFLYLPDYSQEYWKPWNNKKHVNIFKPEFIRDYLEDKGYKKIFVSNVDLYNSFIAIAEK
jgi:predicted SAM-dependent methyltransferase